MEAAVVARKSRRDTFGLFDCGFMLLTSFHLVTDPISAADPSPQLPTLNARDCSWPGVAGQMESAIWEDRHRWVRRVRGFLQGGQGGCPLPRKDTVARTLKTKTAAEKSLRSRRELQGSLTLLVRSIERDASEGLTLRTPATCNSICRSIRRWGIGDHAALAAREILVLAAACRRRDDAL